ncbi:hypothetical protein Droror1_Dr00003436 [Drosera rotundifolia]
MLPRFPLLLLQFTSSSPIQFFSNQISTVGVRFSSIHRTYRRCGSGGGYRGGKVLFEMDERLKSLSSEGMLGCASCHFEKRRRIPLSQSSVEKGLVVLEGRGVCFVDPQAVEL